MFHAEARFRQPAVRFRKPVAQIVPVARVSETAVETYLNSFKKTQKIIEDTQYIGLYVTNKEGRKNVMRLRRGKKCQVVRFRQLSPIFLTPQLGQERCMMFVRATGVSHGSYSKSSEFVY
jgi:hypothetical protein